jgi:hypothetical protein
MQWIDGPLLDAYVQDNLTNKTVLKQLAAKWLGCIDALRQSGIAHGDLQFGNIKIVGTDIRLIDYDGMYVPALRHKGSSETGHQNFQHPRRTGKDFDQYIDNFPAWVIYTSLHALAENPSIWTQVNGGDDCLIFRKDDFEAPERSVVFAKLEQTASRELRALLLRLRNYAKLPVQQVPPLGTVQNASGGLPQWLPPSSIVDADPQRSVTTEALRRTVRGKEVRTAQYVLVTTGILCGVCLLGSVFLASPLNAFVLLVTGLAAVATLSVYWQYNAFRKRVKARRLDNEIDEVTRQLDASEARIHSLESRCSAADAEANAVNVELALSLENWTHATQQLEARLSSIRQECESALRQSELNSQEALTKAEAEHDTQLADLAEQLATVEIQGESRLANLLHDLRKRFVDEVLQRHPLNGVQFDGLGSHGEVRLRDAGYKTAYDILAKNPRQVFGIGIREAFALDTWAKGIRSRAEANAPKAVPADYANHVLAECAHHRNDLISQIEGLRQQWSQLKSDLNAASAMQQSEVRNQFKLQEEDLARKKSEFGKRCQDTERTLRKKAKACARRSKELMEQMEERERERKFLEQRRRECLMQSEVFRLLTFKTFLGIVMRIR